MKKQFVNLFKTSIIILLVVISANVYSQQTVRYDYAEVIVIQKIKSKPNSDIKKIYLNSATTVVDKDEISDITKNSELMQYMNKHNWQFVMRNGVEPGNTAPVWFNYIFRKKKK